MRLSQLTILPRIRWMQNRNDPGDVVCAPAYIYIYTLPWQRGPTSWSMMSQATSGRIDVSKLYIYIYVSRLYNQKLASGDVPGGLREGSCSGPTQRVPSPIYMSVRGVHFVNRIFSGQALATQKKDMEALHKQEATAKDSASCCIFMCECLIHFRHCLLLPVCTYSM